MLRNHGLLTVGRTSRKPSSGCTSSRPRARCRFAAHGGRRQLRRIPQAIVDDGIRQFEVATRGRGGNLAWPALMRQLDATQPGFRS
jgi:hypothetical protein